MTIDKAIKNLRAGRTDCGMIPPGEYTATIDLATEALKYLKYSRKTFPARAPITLPGETKD